jgi:2-amino-4-hydroxy-6-hydroxymethyldihydropteridine diphosphokinase
MDEIWIALGANIPGTFGSPHESLTTAIREIETAGLAVFARSPVYSTPPVGSVRQPQFLNMVVGIRGSVGLIALLRFLKRLERMAGRRQQGHWRPRPLDLDILDYGGRVVGRPGRRRMAGRLSLPHPELHKRGFVLVPLVSVAPHWWHPVLGMNARQLLAKRPYLARGIAQAGWGAQAAGKR